MADEKKIDPTLWTKLLSWLKARLSESSTWTWLVVVAGYFGYTLDPSLIEYIAGVGVSIIALIQFIKKDPITEVKKEEKDSSDT